MSARDITQEIRARGQARQEQRNGTTPGTPQPPVLPEIVTADSMMQLHAESTPPDELVEGILHRGEKLMLAGPSKANKTWSLVDLGISIATGEPFWNLPTTQGDVLLLNFEIQPYFMGGRLERVARAKQLEGVPNLYVWNLRGHRAGFDTILTTLRAQMEERNYALVIIDPLYSGLQGKDENKAGDISELMGNLESIAVKNSAVAMAHHFAKGNSAMKDSLDRASGSGVFARDPDCVLTLNPHEKEGNFVCEFTLRNFPPREKLGLRVDFPLLVPTEDIDTDAIKGAFARKCKVTAADIAELIPIDGTMFTTDMKKAADERHGIGKSKFYMLFKEAKESGLVEETPTGNRRKLKAPRS